MVCVVFAGVFEEVYIVFAGLHVGHFVQHWLSLLEGVVLTWHCCIYFVFTYMLVCEE